ncbi:MAG: hypothetical protein M1818_005603 [Claussenomyces sp. TS43310]|nr:MAG: hypothetical protein M1818_005603 [Claussenomyces sp. TS43310]
MRLGRSRVGDVARLTTLLFPTVITALGNIDCSRIVTEGKTFDLVALEGMHSVMTSHEQPPAYINTTYSIDICRPLKKPAKESHNWCPGGTRVCGVEHTINADTGADMGVSKVIPIAGELQEHKGGPLDAQVTRLRTSSSHSDSEKEGLRIELNGGIYENRKQRAIVEFICDEDRTGDEGNFDPHAEVEARGGLEYRADNGSFCMSSLTFLKYEPDPGNGDVDILRLEWRTKYACEDQRDKDLADSKGWGFFTWFILIAFLGTATYLIFGSWLNYNRYGARGWDLLPHGDTIRDLPYLFKDWARRVIGTLQGSGSRGGYSAV